MSVIKDLKNYSQGTLDSQGGYQATPNKRPKTLNSLWEEGNYQQLPDGQSSPKSSSKVQLFIGGMSSATDLAALQDHLKSIAQADTAVYISIVKRLKRKTFSGYGILKNIDQFSADTLLKIGHFKFDGCWYGIKPFLKKKSDISCLRNNRAEKKIYLKGITEEVVEADLEKYFSRFGDLLHVQIGKHQDTNHYKGFGFIEYSQGTSIEAVLAETYHKVKGAQILCERSKVHKPFGKLTDKNSCTKTPLTKQMPKSYMAFEASKIRHIPQFSQQTGVAYFKEQSQLIEANHFRENLRFRMSVLHAR